MKYKYNKKKKKVKNNYKRFLKAVERTLKMEASNRQFTMSIFETRNPYILVRKNFKLLFRKFIKQRTITPLLFKFLHLAYFKLNIKNIYRPRLITKLDSYATRLFKYNLSTFKNYKFSPIQYLFVLMEKKTHYQKIMDIYSRKSKYNRQLHSLYYFQKAKKSDFSGFSRCPQFLHVSTEDYPYNQHDYLRPFEHIYIRKILNFFYPVTEIHFKETHIHGKPMKTKLPRRI